MDIRRKQEPTKLNELIVGEVYHVYPLNELVEIEKVEESDSNLIIKGKWPYDYDKKFTFASRNNDLPNAILLNVQLFHHIVFPEGMPEKIVIADENSD